MSAATGTGVGIPRLQELEFLETGMQSVIAEMTYDEIRRALIEHMNFARRSPDLRGNHAGRRSLGRDADNGKYFHNANECLSELMRLGWVERAALPSSRKALDSYRATKFAVAPEGQRWAQLVADDFRTAYDELLRGLWRLHPQLRDVVMVIARGRFRIPMATWSEVHGEFSANTDQERRAARAGYIAFLADRCAGAVAAGVTGWEADRDAIHQAITIYVEKLSTRAARRDRDAFPRNRDFVQACEEAVVSFAFERAGARVDFITIEILRRWLRTLNIAGFSYHVPGPPTLTFWATADVTEDATGLPRVTRRVGSAWSDKVIEDLPGTFARAADQVGGSFAPIHIVRAGVCSRLGVSEAVFDRTLAELLKTQVETVRPFQVHLDPASLGALPPTERPFLFEIRGRERPFHVMSLINKPSGRRKP